MTRERHCVPGKASKPHLRSRVGFGVAGGADHASFESKTHVQVTRLVIHTLKEDDFFSPTEKSENTALLLGVIPMTVVANSSFLRCGQAGLFSPKKSLVSFVFRNGWERKLQVFSMYVSDPCTRLPGH